MRFILLCILTSLSAFASDDKLYVTNKMLASPESFKRAIKNHIKDYHETEYPVNQERVYKLIEKCNPKKNLNKPETYLGGFDVCMDLFVFSFSAGTGKFSLSHTDDSGNKLDLDGGATFLGTQAIFPFRLGTSIILEAKYWYFPTLSANDELIGDAKNASMLDGLLVYQKRFGGSAWSYRTGLMGTKMPVVKDLDQNGIEMRSSWLIGPLFGLKFAYNRSKGFKHLLYGDAIPVLNSDGEYFDHPIESFILRSGYKYFLSEQFALTADLERSSFYTKDDDKTIGMAWALGMHLYLF